ncbi:hypothetical protein B0T18DRAFT_412872 [Schizothecium vesticola]|uniref:Uncharacterized protein n=1 Tax=Schizothecium vesticola TaxID=314040 RepID=A0AA40K6A8_9PEZI|nr:hypothetical protein B0T18DRAFT_412872 [Schizothecium vesticola]
MSTLVNSRKPKDLCRLTNMTVHPPCRYFRLSFYPLHNLSSPQPHPKLRPRLVTISPPILSHPEKMCAAATEVGSRLQKVMMARTKPATSRPSVMTRSRHQAGKA